ncbi:unnamed protein product [Sympodiomycopsis kandeliae]
MSWFSNQWDKISRAFEPQADEEEEAQKGINGIEVIWGKERFQVNLPPTGSTSKLHTLQSLKKHISDLTSIPPAEQKLVYHGLILKDNSASLRSYNIRSGSRIMIIGSVGDKPGDKVSSHFGPSSTKEEEAPPRQLTKGELLAEERKRKENDRSEEGILARIEEVTSDVEGDLKKQLDEFVAELQSSQQSSSEELKQRQRVLNELFSRALLSLDAIPTVSETTRQKRKEAVRSVQKYIDQLDSAWEHKNTAAL